MSLRHGLLILALLLGGGCDGGLLDDEGDGIRVAESNGTEGYPCPAEEGAMERTSDGLWVWSQPGSSGDWGTGWNGQCGNTAAANYLLHACNWCLAPDQLNYAWDGLPGTRRSTVARLINDAGVCRQTVRVHEGSTDDATTPIRLCAQASGTNPVALLVNQTGGKTLHWINVLGCNCRLEACGLWSGELRYITWGTTQTSSCDEVRGWLEDVPWPYSDANWIGP